MNGGSKLLRLPRSLYTLLNDQAYAAAAMCEQDGEVLCGHTSMSID